ncbi:4'-phosphopantetheinyl transferase superfamily protein [Pedobacter sp. MC2016-05]|uniref:4'-phosphopantetheinyl transferase family protein n=1 Tax=Pedobacter sp. MC2016-05 TaxID=2994474 RepID=UPI0022473AA5|nr:4'-phosphopantetheinyl transferase superfamily protein [Pedobacter sp. MC2016-05]MCX2474757.1 4'-phosphopantetheinyl transferase superfamily protein [Pedobacter sp. MC2016-05]
MLGNDIVDLKFAKLHYNWRRKGYLNKIFSARELELINSSKSEDTMVWVLWSMKEAAYKCYNRLTSERLFNPQAFECALFGSCNNSASGVVKRSGQSFFTKTEISKNYVHTLAYSCTLMLDHLSVHHHKNNAEYSVAFTHSTNCSLQKDRNHLPEVIDKKTQHKHMASISHDGRYLCIAFLKV